MHTNSKKDLKVLHINSYYICSQLHQNMIEELDKFVNNSIFVPAEYGYKSVVNCNKNVKITECFKKRHRFIFRYKQKRILKSIQNSYDIEKFDLIHSYTLFTDGNVAYQLYKKYKIPYVVAVRNTDVNVFFKYMVILRKRGINILKNASAIFFLSDVYKQTVINKYVPNNLKNEILNKCYVIPNGIDSFWLKNLFTDKKVLDDKIKCIKDRSLKIVYAGDINKNKNVTSTCKAVEMLRDNEWNIEFYVAGRIKDKKIFDSISNKITYLGMLNKNDLISIYRKSHLFVMPSFTETFGLVYAEAISQGLPVIYTKGQGFDKQFDEGIVGYHIDPNDIIDIKDKILNIIESYEKITNNISSNALLFSWKDIAYKYYNIYMNL